MTQLIDLMVEDEGWLDALPSLKDVAEQAAQLALRAAGLSLATRSISILACDDARIAMLNNEFRDKPRPTNVLSWPAFDLTPSAPGEAPLAPPEHNTPGPQPLGDVAIALQTCQQEAETAAKPLNFHVMHLILHGCLHLLGYDHETPEDAVLMEGMESRALVGAGFPDPYV
ncbi:MAG: rRNA maturation RNase YbeY [Paracoccaceae bacterium]